MMFWKKQICPNCKTGKESYELDRTSECCPYIGCLKKGKCYFYVPLDETHKNGFFKGRKNTLLLKLLNSAHKYSSLFFKIFSKNT